MRHVPVRIWNVVKVTSLVFGGLLLFIWLKNGGLQLLRYHSHSMDATPAEVTAQYVAVLSSVGAVIYGRWWWRLNWLYCILMVAVLLMLQLGVILLLVMGPALASVALFVLISLVILGSRWLSQPISRFFEIRSSSSSSSKRHHPRVAHQTQ